MAEEKTIVKDYTQSGFDEKLNEENSLLNSFIGTEQEMKELISHGMSADMVKAGVFGGFNKDKGIEFKADIVNTKSYLQSRNFVTGTTGWRFDSDGNLEAESGTFRGNLSASVYQLYQEYTTGEDITAGRLCCMKGNIETWGDDANANHQTSTLFPHDCYVDSGAPAVNQDNGLLKTGGVGAVTYRVFIKINVDESDDYYKVQKALLKLNIIWNDLTENHTFKIHRVTADWDETTITWNNQPAYDTFVWEELQINTNYSTNTYYDTDITELYKLWERGTGNGGYANYGLVIVATAADIGSVRFGDHERTGGGSFNQKPYLEITSEIASDGKAYHASFSDYNKVKNIIGIATETKSVDETVKVLSLMEKSYYSGSFTTGKNYYLTNTAGQITSPLTCIPTNYWSIKVGVGKGDRLLVENDRNPKFIKSFTYDDFHNNLTFKMSAPIQTTMIIVKYKVQVDYGTADPYIQGQIILHRDRLVDITSIDGQGVNPDDVYTFLRAKWIYIAAGNGNIELTISSSQTVMSGGEATIYFYE